LRLDVALNSKNLLQRALLCQRQRENLFYVSLATSFLVLCKETSAKPGVLNRWEISHEWEISSMQWEILSDLVQ